jgi:MoaA/NifB/PqqE/SkfB family radical SAM enzyme
MSDRLTYYDLLKSFYIYFIARYKKGLLDREFFESSTRFALGRMFGPYRTTSQSPLIATIAITSVCPLNCYHCSEGYKEKYMLPAETVKKTIDEIAELGCPVIALTGGEPFTRREIIEFIEHIPPSAAAVIYTSGMGLTAKMADFFAKRQNMVICLSLDHSDPEEHDKRRGRKGAHEAVMRAIDLLADTPVQVHVSTLVTKDRIKSGELYDFARDLKKRGVMGIQFFQPRPVGMLNENREILLSTDQENDMFKIAKDLNLAPDAPLMVVYPVMEHASMMGCCAGYARVYIDSHGHVCPCDFAPLNFGKITERSFTKIWKEMRGFFQTPGDRCLIRDNPEIFTQQREERNISFHSLPEPEKISALPPGVFSDLGERGYRILMGNFLLAGVAVNEWYKSNY